MGGQALFLLAAKDLLEQKGGLIDGQGVVAFLLEPVGFGLGNLGRDFGGVGPRDVEVLLAVPKSDRHGDVLDVERPGREVDIRLGDDGGRSILEGEAYALGNDLVV